MECQNKIDEMKTLNEKLQLLIKNRKTMKDSGHSELITNITQVLAIQKQALDNLKQSRDILLKAPNSLRKALNAVHENSAHPSLPLGMDAGQNLNSIIHSGSEIMTLGASLKNSSPLSVEALEKACEHSEQFYNKMNCKVLQLERNCQNIFKLVENVKDVMQLQPSVSESVNSETMISENTSIATIHGEDILASSSALESELNYHDESFPEE